VIPLSGALQVVAAGALFALMSAGVKIVAATQPNAVVVFLRNAFSLLVLLPWIRWSGARGLRTRVLPLHLLRALAGLGAMYCFFFTIGRLQLADAVLLNYTLPLFMPVIAWLWLNEQMTRGVWVAVGLGFAGVALIVKPSEGLVDPVALVGLCAGVLGALAQVTVRRLTRSEPATRIVVYFSLVSTAVSSVPAALVGFSLSGYEVGLLLVVGTLAALAQILLTRGYASAPAARVGPFVYSSVLFAGLLDWLLWLHLPDLLSVAGACLVCLGGAAAMVRRRSAAVGALEVPPRTASRRRLHRGSEGSR
jgi:drug/metabolite transporter (DMT)-like permease